MAQHPGAAEPVDGPARVQVRGSWRGGSGRVRNAGRLRVGVRSLGKGDERKAAAAFIYDKVWGGLGGGAAAAGTVHSCVGAACVSSICSMAKLCPTSSRITLSVLCSSS